VRALEQRVGIDLGCAQRRSGVVVKNGLPVPCREDHDAPLLEVAHRPTADVRLRDPRHLDRALHPRRLAAALE
jgi:hypothetical protein